MNVLLIGVKGQLGQEIDSAWGTEAFQVIGVDLPEFDLTDVKEITALIHSTQPDVVINAAAYTNVDQAEKEKERAFAVNHLGPQYLAAGCQEKKIPLIQISTDYVFNGQKTAPYLESDPVAPLGVYGVSKEMGEAAVRTRLNEHIILRTSWLYGAFGNNFMKTMIRLGREKETLRVVADQTGSPTNTADLAAALLVILRQMQTNRAGMPWGTYHFCNQGSTTWYTFAQTILNRAKAYLALAVGEIIPIPTEDFPTPAARPPYSVLDCTKIEHAFGLVRPDWQTSLIRTLDAYLPSYGKEPS